MHTLLTVQGQMNKEIKKVLLFTTPVFTFENNIDVNPLPPLGLAYLGAVLENSGIAVRIFDCLAEGWNNRTKVADNLIRIGSSFDEIEDIIREFEPDIVGVNSLFSRQEKNARQIYAIAKKVDQNIITIAGGAHPTALPKLVLSDENVDFVVLGEGEETIVDLIKIIEGKRDVSTLDGVGYKKNGQVKIIPKTKFIEDLDKLPFPARHLLNMEKYFGLKASHGTRLRQRFSPIVTSRGCPAKCTFCSAKKVWGGKFRSRSPENVIAEIKLIIDKYQIQEIMFEDDNVTFDAKRAAKIFDLMTEEKLDVVWDTPNGIAAWTLTEELIDKIKESGCCRLNFPIETGNQYVMDKIIKKPLKLEKIKPLVNYARRIGLDVGLFLVIGMPGETEDQIWDSFHTAKELEVYSPHISIATPYPGSELYDLCIEKKYLSDSFSLDDLYISSFCISTENWDGNKLKEIYSKGQRFLLVSFFKKHPIVFLKKVLRKLFTEPVKFLRIIFSVISNKEVFMIF